MSCNHDLADMETACADGMCPLCLAAKVRKLRDAIELQLLNYTPNEKLLQLVLAGTEVK